jgi:2-amino-4-hydroxy-6-hydroxymethyldihydropteridine diphosphokinase
VSTTPIHLGMGSNLGDREAALKRGVRELQALGVRIGRVSSLYETEPVGFRDQGSFLNVALEVSWEGTLEELCRCGLSVETMLDRRRMVKDGPRTLDVDLLLAKDAIVRSENLKVPHPRMHLRRFVLVPLEEIAPLAVHPVFRKTVRELLDQCPDSSWVRRVGAPLTVEPS